MAVPLAAIAGVTQAVVGGYQAIKGAGTKAPQSDFQIPQQYAERMKRVQGRAAFGSQLPGQTLMEQRQQAVTSKGISALEAAPSANYTSSVSRFMQQERDAMADIGIKAAERKDQLESEVLTTMKEGEAYQVAQQQRKFDKEAAKLAEKQALTGSGMQNVMGGVQTIAQGAAMGGGKGGGV